MNMATNVRHAARPVSTTRTEPMPFLSSRGVQLMNGVAKQMSPVTRLLKPGSLMA